MSHLEGDNMAVERVAALQQTTHQATFANGGEQASRRCSTPSEHSLSDSSTLRQKRKSDEDLEEAIRNNPSLYGVRRTGRARAPVNNLTEDSEGDSDPDLEVKPAKRRKLVSAPSAPASLEVSDESASEEEDDEESYDAPSRSRKRRHQPAPKQASRPQAAFQYEPEKRLSSRNAGRNVASYAEEDEDAVDEDDVAEWIEEHPDVNGSVKSIDHIVGHKAKDPTKPKAYLRPEECEYLVKWTGKSYHELEFCDFASLIGVSGFGKIKHYAEKHLAYDAILEDPDVSPEDKEEIGSLRAERDDQILLRKKVERVVDSRLNDETQRHEYYIKWKGTEYLDNTWELSSFIQELAPDRIDHYKLRRKQERHMKSDPVETNVRSRTAFTLLEEQPEYVKGGQLRDFQMKGLNFLAANWTTARNVILADEMGLGKTVQTIAFIQWLRHNRNQQGPFLVVVPLSTMGAWVDTFEKWSPDLNFVVYHGGKTNARTSRQIIREREWFGVNEKSGKLFPKFHCLLTTPELINQDKEHLREIKWQFLAVDEAHRLKDQNSVLYQSLLALEAPTRLLITGTPIQNNLRELAALIRFLNPREQLPTEEIELTDEGAGEMIRKLRLIIEPYMIRRTKKLVETDLPPKIERTLRVELSDTALKLYKDLVGRNAAMEEDSSTNGQARVVKSAVNNLVMELKKVSDHPLLLKDFQEAHSHLHSKEERLRLILQSSGKMMLLEQLLDKMRKDDHRVLIFCQLVGMMDILSEYLLYRGIKFQRLDGTVASKDREAAIEHFNAPDSEDQVFLLSTRAGGMGINLATADTVILFDSDWNPQQDMQAMSRAHRIGQKKQVTVYRLVSKDTIEEDILERARNKLMLEFLTIQAPDREKAQMTKQLADRGAIGEAKDAAEINRILKSRGQKMFEQEGNQKKLEELNIDSVLATADDYETEQLPGVGEDSDDRVNKFLESFRFNDVKIEWNDIIPKADFDRIKQEEYDKASRMEAQRLEEENQPRKRNATKREAITEAGADAEDDDDDEDAAETSKRPKKVAKRGEKKRVKAGHSSDEDGDDPSRPLSGPEIDNLIGGCTSFGPLTYQKDRILLFAGLKERDLSVIQQTWAELVVHAQESKDRILAERAEKERIEQKSIPKKQAGEPMIKWRGSKEINCDTILLRPKWLELLGTHVRKHFENSSPDKPATIQGFSIDVDTQAANYGRPWTKENDMMLLFGVWRHGHGQWQQIRDDAELDLRDKIFLDENKKEASDARGKGEPHRKPEAVHLVRRAKYLLCCVAAIYAEAYTGEADLEAQKQFDNYHRNKQKITPMGNAATFASSTGSPLTGLHGKSHLQKAKARPDGRPGSSHSRADSYSGTNGHSGATKLTGMEPKSKSKGKRNSDHLDSDESQSARKKVKAEQNGTPSFDKSVSKKRSSELVGEGGRESPKRVKSEGTPGPRDPRGPLYSNAFAELKATRKRVAGEGSRGRASEGRRESERPDSRRGRSRSPAHRSSKANHRARTPEDGPRAMPKHRLPAIAGGVEMDLDDDGHRQRRLNDIRAEVRKRLGHGRNSQRDELVMTKVPDSVEHLKDMGTTIERLGRGEAYKKECWDYFAAYYWIHDLDLGSELRTLYHTLAAASHHNGRKAGGKGSGNARGVRR